MKHLSLFALLLFYACASQAQTTKYKLDSLVYHSRDTAWNIYSATKNLFTYDDRGNCIEDRQTSFDEKTRTWSKGSKTLYFFDEHHNDTTTIWTSWSEEKQQWVSYNKYRETYDDKNRRTSQTQLNLDPVKGVWIRVWRRLYTYDDADRLLTEIYQDSAGSDWKNRSKEAYQYTTNARNKYYYGWNNNAWTLSSRDENLLNAKGKVTTNTYYWLQNGSTEANPVWNGMSKYEYKYNTKGDTVETFAYNWAAKTWLGNDYQWVPTSHLISTYDAFDNLVAWTNEGWNAKTQVYDTQYRVERVYNTDVSHENLCIPRTFSNDNRPSSDFMYMQIESKHYGFENGKWNYFAPNNYYYSPILITGMEEESKDFQTTRVMAYPNPMSDILHVQGKASLYDMFGNKVAAGETTLLVSELPNGIYLLQTTTGHTKVVKE